MLTNVKSIKQSHICANSDSKPYRQTLRNNFGSDMHCTSFNSALLLWEMGLSDLRMSEHTYLFWARLMLHSCQTVSTTWLAILRGILPPWWLVLSTLNPSIATGNRIHFCAEWEWTRERKKRQNVWECNGCCPWNEMGLSWGWGVFTCLSFLRWGGRSQGHWRDGGVTVWSRHLMAVWIDSGAVRGPRGCYSGDVWLRD